MISRWPKTIPVALALCATYLVAQQTAPPTAEAIMAKVAANQDSAEDARRHYVYIQHAKVVSRKGHTVMCEEVTDSRITPTETDSHAELLKLNGRLLRKKQYIAYTELSPTQNRNASEQNKTQAEVEGKDLTINLDDDDTDRDLVENMRANLTRNKSKDGIDARLFPLTSKAQAEYVFRFIGQEHINGHDVFHIDFHPKVKDDYGWKGDAYIDTTSFQPVVVRTTMSRKVPFAVRTLLGTNVPGLGFSIVYAPQPDGVWFPVSFGTEFKLHVLFFFSREITINAENRNFEKTHVDSKIIIPSQ
jgi:hypothetical protein